MNPITVSTSVKAPIDKVWEYWNEPEHIQAWAFASDDWECPYSENDLEVGGKFKTTMAAKDKSTSFDFEGTYTSIIPNELIEYTIADGRNVQIIFEQTEDGVQITETFDPENENPPELQSAGWQAILDNFKKHAEKN